MPRKKKVASSCYAMPLRGGRWGACQVLGVVEEGTDVVAFSWVGDHPPTLAELADAEPLLLTHHAHRGQMERLYVSGPPPAAFIHLGERAPVVDPTTPGRSYGGWDSLTLQPRLQKRWDDEVPASEKARYRDGDGPVTIGETTVKPGSRVRIGAAPDAMFPLAVEDAVPWSALDAAGQLTEIEYTGRDPGVLTYAASRALISTLVWREHGQTTIDVRGAQVSELRVDASRRLTLALDDEVETLVVMGHGRGRTVAVDLPSEGRDLELRIWEPKKSVLPPAVKGLSALRELSVSGVKTLDLRAVRRGYPGLTSITVWTRYGTLVHARELARLPSLTSLTLYDVYDMNVQDLPELEALPALRHACFHGLRKSDAQALKQRWKKLPHLDISGAKNDAWVAANADNPLRDWVDDDEGFGERACKIYAKAYREAGKAKGKGDAKRTLTGFVTALNRLDDRCGGPIDTLRREQALEAYGILIALTSVNENEAFEWFNELRAF